MEWESRRVLVTGAGGFIGSHLCDALLTLGAKVTAMIRYSSRSDWGNLEFLHGRQRLSLNVVAGNIEDSAFVRSIVPGHDVVFHLAALIGIPYSYVAPAAYVRTNVEGTVNLLEASRQAGVERFVQTSTSETYGTAQYTPMDENHPLQGQSPYSASKIGADKVAESYYRSFGLPVATIRPFNTYGPRQSARAIIPTIVSQALTRPAIALGSLDPVRDFTFVQDTVNGFLSVAATNQAIGTTVNIGYGQGITILKLAETILSMMGVSKPLQSTSLRTRPLASEVGVLVCDNTRARATCGWEPQWSLEQGLRETIDFIGAHPELYKPDFYQL
jgi:NAD dependent epimerase/dehydratase